MDAATTAMTKKEKFDAAAQKRAERKARKEKDYLGEAIPDALLRLERDISKTIDDRNALTGFRDVAEGEYQRVLDRPVEDPTTVFQKIGAHMRGEGPSAEVIAGQTARDEAFETYTQATNEIAKKQDIFKDLADAKGDTSRTLLRAAEMGFKNKGEVYFKRSQAQNYIDEYKKIAPGIIMGVLENELGFRPAEGYLETPKGKQLLEAAMVKARDLIDTQLGGNFNFNEAEKFLYDTRDDPF